MALSGGKKMNKGKILPVILLLAITISLVQGVTGISWHTLQGGERSNLALAAPSQDPIFLPFLLKTRVEESPFGVDIGAIHPSNGLNQMVDAGAQWPATITPSWMIMLAISNWALKS